MREEVEGIEPIPTDQLLSREETEFQAQYVPQWALRENSIDREVEFHSFQDAIRFVNQVADVAEAEDHHPEICIRYHRVRLDLTTHKAGGLTLKDFVMASEIDRVVQEQPWRRT